jgi:hypothetical protein
MAKNEGDVKISDKVPGQVDLSRPIKVGDQEFSSVVLREPTSGELRGLSLANLLQLDVNALIKVLPRLSTPFLSADVIQDLPVRDLTALGLELTGFFVDTGDSRSP